MNLATKQDVGIIINKIKSAEISFVNRTEKPKADLTLLTNLQTDLIKGSNKYFSVEE